MLSELITALHGQHAPRYQPSSLVFVIHWKHSIQKRNQKGPESELARLALEVNFPALA